MPTLTLSSEQVLELVEQLPADKQELVFRALLRKRWPEWEALSRDGEDRLRAAARERGRDWDRMNEQEKEDFIDDLVHEDRPCSQ